MSSLSAQCVAFLRLAIRGDLYTTDSQEEYHSQLRMQKYDSPWDIFDFISRWKTKLFFKIQDVVSLVKQLPEGTIGLDALDKFARYSELINIAAENVVRSDRREYMNIDYKIYTYLHLETLPINNRILQDYQRIILTTLMRVLERIQEDGNQLWFKDSLRSLNDLFKKSTKFPKNLLEGLFKRFGLENYTRLIFTPEHYQAALKKDMITKWEAALIIRNSASEYNYFITDTFLDILNKCDVGAKEYFRGFIYCDASFKDFATSNEYFMLSEDMTPMDLNLKQIAWPGGFLIQRLSSVPEEVQKVWGPIFANFGILTH